MSEMSSAGNAFVGEVRHVAEDNLLGEPFDNGGLADARLAYQHRVVLGPAAQHLLHAFELVIAAHQRIELRSVAASVRSRLNSARVAFSLTRASRRLSLRSWTMSSRTWWRRMPFIGTVARPIVLHENAKAEMLGPDVVVQEAIRFLL